jgi:glycosyltransferase involved in cell wall biosynthesis
MTTKVLLAIRSLAGRGGERSVLTLAEGFKQLGCEVHIFCFLPSAEYDIDTDFHYHHIDINQKKYKLFITTESKYTHFAKLFDQYVLEHIGQPDLILSNLNQTNRILSKSKLKHIAYIIRNTFSKEFAHKIKNDAGQTIQCYQEIYKKHPCICISQGVYQDLTSTLGNLPNIHTIYNAFDRNYIRKQASLDTPDYSDYLLHVGAFCQAKAHDILLKAYAKSTQKLPLLLLGQGELEDEIRQLSEELNIKHKVHFLGFKKNPYPYMKHAKALILSSRFEGFVRVIPEALALDTPVISTDCPSGPNEILPIYNLVPVDDIEALAQKINQIIEEPRQFQVSFDEKYLPHHIAQQYLDYFNITVVPKEFKN